MDTSLGNLSLMLNTDHYVVITHDQRHCEFYINVHLYVLSNDLAILHQGCTFPKHSHYGVGCRHLTVGPVLQW